MVLRCSVVNLILLYIPVLEYRSIKDYHIREKARGSVSGVNGLALTASGFSLVQRCLHYYKKHGIVQLSGYLQD